MTTIEEFNATLAAANERMTALNIRMWDILTKLSDEEVDLLLNQPLFNQEN